MSFAFRASDRSLTAALRRIAGGEIDGALATLGAGAPDAGGVHDIRKRVKKLRGLIRLLRAGFDGEAEIAELRRVAEGLAGVRDAEVMLGVHDMLGGAEGPLRAVLEARVAAARGEGGAVGDPEALREVLAALRERARGWRVQGRDERVLRKGLERSLRRGQVAFAAAQAQRGAEALHDWRKRVKDLWYQLRLLHPVWPEVIDPWRRAADELGEWLGTHHDLAVFVDWLEPSDDPAAPALRAAARAKAAEIEERALDLGRLLHAAEPEALAEVWTDLWAAWRR